MYPNTVRSCVQHIEETELALTVFNARRALSANDKQLEVRMLGNSTLLIEPNSPASPYYNRVKGWGKEEPGLLDEILQIYHEAGIAPCFDMLPHHLNEEVSGALSARGYRLAEQLVYLAADPQELTIQSEIPDGLRVEKVTAENVDVLLELINQSTGGQIPPEVKERKKDYFTLPAFQNFLVYVDGEAAAMGSLFIHEDVGYMANDFTFPAFRGKGCQTALLHRRFETARELGLQALYTDVQFGTTSHDNMLRNGFHTVYLNSLWISGGAKTSNQKKRAEQADFNLPLCSFFHRLPVPQTLAGMILLAGGGQDVYDEGKLVYRGFDGGRNDAEVQAIGRLGGDLPVGGARHCAKSGKHRYAGSGSPRRVYRSVLQADGDGWAGVSVGREAGQAAGDQFLGILVRPVPAGDAGFAGGL